MFSVLRRRGSSAVRNRGTVGTVIEMGEIEKIAFILEQVGRCLDCQDYEGAQIQFGKINPQVFEAKTSETKETPKNGCPSLLELKKIYYQLMIRYHSHGNDYLEIFRCYKAVYEIQSVKEDPREWMPILKKMCWYLALLAHGPTQSTLINSILEDKNLSQIPKSRLLLKQFSTPLLISKTGWIYAFNREFDDEIKLLGGSFGCKASEDIKKRLIEHNIMVCAKYEPKLTLAEFAKEVGVADIQEAEVYLSEMIASKAVVAKIDMVSGMVYFPTADPTKFCSDTFDAHGEIVDLLMELNKRRKQDAPNPLQNLYRVELVS